MAPLLAGVIACLAALLEASPGRAAATVPGSPGAEGVTDGNAAIVSAEAALQRGDCGLATTRYQQAVRQLSEPRLASHAAAVALACGQYPQALTLASRWLQLAPGDADATLVLVRADLGAQQIAEARRHFGLWLAANAQKIPETIQSLSQSAGSEPTLAMLRNLEAPQLAAAGPQLATAGLALEAWDAKLALRLAQRAREAGAGEAEVAQITARAEAVLGDAKAASAAARLAATSKGGRLTPAQTLMMLGQEDAAQTELQGLLNDKEAGGAAARLLAELAIERSDYALAEQRCNGLLHDPASAPMAVYYLGLIAERRGDDDAATRDYALLMGTAFEGEGRRRTASILYRQGDRDAAVRVLSAPRDAEPDERIRADLASAELLSVAGAADEALSRVESALRRSPGNPDISYQRAVLLERAGRVSAAVTALEILHRERPLDDNISNALGYTLADHRRDLPRAEQLIRAALAGQPDNPAVLDSLGWVLYRRGHGDAALPVLERAFRLLHDGDIGAHWGEVLWTAGRKSEARAAWQRSLASDPDNPRLAEIVHRYAPALSAPKPPPALEPAPLTTI
ncbi:MAG TPA: tetratricopeptide repeat protein [Steroidobacteraceae bacterium]|nr:tetratricopeptide repeat protein [Steroidobacteraceae bacterium]